jgi:hypothetical protein
VVRITTRRCVPRIEQAIRWIGPVIIERWVARREIEEGLAQVEDALETKAETADGGRIVGLVAEAKLMEGACIAGAEGPIVHDPQPRTLDEQRMVNAGEGRRPADVNLPRAGVVGVLDELAEHRHGRAIAVIEVATDLLNISLDVMLESAHAALLRIDIARPASPPPSALSSGSSPEPVTRRVTDPRHWDRTGTA